MLIFCLLWKNVKFNSFIVLCVFCSLCLYAHIASYLFTFNLTFEKQQFSISFLHIALRSFSFNLFVCTTSYTRMYACMYVWGGKVNFYKAHGYLGITFTLYLNIWFIFNCIYYTLYTDKYVVKCTKKKE